MSFDSIPGNARSRVERAFSILEEAQPHTRAVTHFLKRRALRLADESDQRLQGGEAPRALEGLLFTVKSCFAIEEEPWESGLLARKGCIAESSAPAIRLLEKAGAIPVALTNVPEALLWVESANLLHGRTRHPADRKRTSGGSSGGEAVTVSSGAVDFGIGTDFGGSLRIPAHYCGVWALKPTSGLVSHEGTWPRPGGPAERQCVSGPLALDPGILKRVATVLTGGVLAQVNPFSPPTLYVLRKMPGHPLCKEVTRALESAIDRARELGFRIEDLPPEAFRGAARMWLSVVKRREEDGYMPLHTSLGNGKRISLSLEWFRFLTGRARHTIMALLAATFESIFMKSDFGIAESLERVAGLKKMLKSRFADGSMILMPVAPWSAPLHHVAKLFPFHWIWSGIWNALEFPAVAFPVAKAANGLPIGLQVVAGEGNDFNAIALAERLR